jgi:hypothetical protein
MFDIIKIEKPPFTGGFFYLLMNVMLVVVRLVTNSQNAHSYFNTFFQLTRSPIIFSNWSAGTRS